MKTARRRAREFAVQGVYQWQLNALTATNIENNLRENEHFAKADESLLRGLLFGVIHNADILDKLLVNYYDRDAKEVSPVERAILRVAALELTQHADTPYPVIINEAIEIAKTFGGTDGHRFVNGVLDKLAADVRAPEVEAQKNRPPRPPR